VLVDREVETDTGEQLIRTIQQHEIATGPSDCCSGCSRRWLTRYVLAETAIDETDQTEVTDVATRTSTTLHLVEAGEIVSLIHPPAIERNETNASGLFGPVKRIFAPNTMLLKLLSPYRRFTNGASGK
jgi:hypothetical protein